MAEQLLIPKWSALGPIQMGTCVDIRAARRSRTPRGLGFGGGKVIHFNFERKRRAGPKAGAYQPIRAIASFVRLVLSFFRISRPTQPPKPHSGLTKEARK
jgi:hypothetical protein